MLDDKRESKIRRKMPLRLENAEKSYKLLSTKRNAYPVNFFRELFLPEKRTKDVRRSGNTFVNCNIKSVM